MWPFSLLQGWWSDARYALRTLTRNPGFVLVAVVALALGIGANTTVFTVIGKALSFDLGVDQVDRVVFLNATDNTRRMDFFRSYGDAREFVSQIKSIAHLSAYRFVPANVSDGRALPERYFAVQMTAGGFDIIGRKPALGRAFGADDMRADAVPTVVLSHRMWTNRYGSDAAILRRIIRVNDVPRVVIGVMPAGMQFPEDTDVWIPFTAADAMSAGGGAPLIFGRLADGTTLAVARAEVDTIARNFVQRSPGQFKGLVVDVQPILVMYGVYESRPMLIAMLFAVGFVLLIACADVANILLSRASARSREICIRIAIGAGRMQIVRMLLVESVLLSIAGGIAGWMVALAGLHWFDGLTADAGRPAWVNFSMDARAFAYLAAISVGSGILFGLAPALRLARADVHSGVKDGGYGVAGGVAGRRLSGLLVVFEMTLSVVLLVAAGLMIRSSLRLYDVPLGVDAANVLTMHINLPEAKYPRSEDEIAFHRALKSRLEALPGVETAAVASNLPGSGWLNFQFEKGGEDHPLSTGGLVVQPDYFRVLRVRARAGRLFTAQDGAGGPPVAMVNESFAAKYWSGENPVGRQLRLTVGPNEQLQATVVGVIPDIRQNFRRPTERDPLIYLPYAAAPQRVVYIVARTRVPPATLAAAFRREIQSIDENLPAYDVRTLEQRIAQNRLNVTAFGALLTVFAAIALALACVGIYGVAAHSVAARRREIGIRVAVGGQRRNIVGLVLGQGMRQVALGLLLGLPLALAVTRVFSRALVGISPGDPITFVSVAAVLAAAGLLGCAVPARRAMRVDPVEVLRSE
jgi:putative ABC transport system permease protein